MDESDHTRIRQLLDDYLRMYAGRDDLVTTRFAEDFSGFTRGGDFLVKDTAQWVAITRQDFAQVKEPITIELKDVAIQSLADSVAVATSVFVIHLPVEGHVLSRETARLVLILRKEAVGWMITHSSISILCHGVGEGETYPLNNLVDRNRLLEELAAERTIQLSAANESLRRTNEQLSREIADRALADDRYRTILAASPDDITITDAAGRILMISPAAYKLFGYELTDDFHGMTLTDFLVPEDRERAIAQTTLRLKGVATGASEYRALRKDGTTFDIEANVAVIRDAAGSPTGLVLIIRDVTERKRVEAEKERLEALNQQLLRVESLGRMAGAIAHHFNNKLCAVIVGLELAMDDLPGNAAALASLADALDAAHQAAEISGSMLTYLGQTTAKREALDLSEVCLRRMSLLRASIPADVPLETDFPVPGPVIRANDTEIQDVLTILATNAWEAMGDRQSAIRLAVRTIPAAEIPAANRFPLDAKLNDPVYSCIEVADAGVGIEGKHIAMLFDPFFSSKFTGRGLGLPTALGVVRAHGGAITVESELGKGSIFRVFLPVSAQAVPRTSVQVGPPSRPSATGTVLLVDDEPMVRNGLSRMLAKLGCTVLAAEDGVAALELFVQHRDEISCVLCDVTMPRMDGWETLTALRILAPDMPVILASGYSETQVMGGQHSELPQAFLHNPYDSKALADALERVLAIDARS